MKVFISYRRSDTRHIAGRLAERLNDAPGVQKVFIDVDGIEPGANFIAKIDKALDESEVCLIIIGNDWVAAHEGGAPARIFDENDFVRLEAAAALGSGNKVVPVLVDGAPMPEANALPQELRRIVAINGVYLRHDSFDHDMDLVEDAVFSRKARTPITRFFRRRPFLTLLLKAVAGVLVAGSLLVGAAVIHSEATGGRALDETLGSHGLVWLGIVAVLVSGAIVPIWLSVRR